jgi:hypothetical protein
VDDVFAEAYAACVGADGEVESIGESVGRVSKYDDDIIIHK